MKKDLISVIVPIYKVEKYLNTCVDSIIAQTYKNLEIILVDDGSPDNCGRICDEYALKDSRIKVIHQQNGGLSAARNAGLDVATGEYIGFVDSDDYIAPDMYEKLYNALKNNNCDLSICNIICIDSSGKKRVLFDSAESKVYYERDIMTVLCKPDIVCFITTVNRLYKQFIFNNLRFDIGKTNEDEFIAHKVFSQCSKIVVIEDFLYYYLQRDDSIMGSPLTVNRADGVEGIYKRLQFLRCYYPEIDYAKASKPLLDAYRNFKSGFRPQNELEEKRVMEIDKMASETYNAVKSKCDWKNKLFFEYPKIYSVLYRIKAILRTFK